MLGHAVSDLLWPGFADDRDVSRTVIWLFTCDLVTSVWNRCG